MSEEKPSVRGLFPPAGTPDPMEAWGWFSLLLSVAMGVCWGVVFSRLGVTSVKIHAWIIPTLGMLTFPIMAWGLVVSVRKPPVLRRTRIVSFLLLTLVAWVGTSPVIAPPLSTEDWVADYPVRLPFDGIWHTAAGGEDPKRNYHTTTTAFRWGYDFNIVKDGKAFRLDGAKNEDHFCYGKPVLAPVGGKVVRARNGIVDNVPGEVNRTEIFGNHIIIEAAENEYFLLAHLQNKSLTVEAGDSVAISQPIATCGNSGYAVAPHVHIHAQNTLDFPIGESLPLRFDRYSASEKAVTEKGMPNGATGFELPDGDFVEHR